MCQLLLPLASLPLFQTGPTRRAGDAWSLLIRPPEAIQEVYRFCHRHRVGWRWGQYLPEPTNGNRVLISTADQYLPRNGTRRILHIDVDQW